MRTHYFSRSARDMDDTCPRWRFWTTIFGGRGIEPAEDARELLFGTACHVGLASMWRQQDWLRALKEDRAYQELAPRDQWLVESLLHAYKRVVYPQLILEGWEPIHIEREVGVSRIMDGIRLVLLVQPDLILKNIYTGRIRYVEFKTTKILTQNYVESWRYAPQLAAGADATLETLDIPVDECVVSLLYKGEFDSAGQYWRSPFTSTWVREKDGTTTYTPKRPQYYKGWARFNVEDLGVTPEEWVNNYLSEDVLLAQLPSTQSFILRDEQVQTWLDESFQRELVIAKASEGEMVDMRAFPHRFRQCRPVMGRECPMLGPCWNPTIREDPIRSGLFVRRTPHHETERLALEAHDGL